MLLIKKALVLSLITVVCSGSLWAQNLKKGFKEIAKNEIADATKIFTEALDQKFNCPASNYAMAVISAEKTVPADLFKAYDYIRKAVTFKDKLTTEGDYKKVNDYVTPEIVVSYFQTVDNMLSKSVLKSKSSTDIARFIKNCQQSKYLSKITRVRDSLAFLSVRETNTLVGYKTFLANYPNAKEKTEAIRLRNILIFHVVQSENTMAAYKQFISDYPYAEQVGQAKTGYMKLDYDSISRTHSIENYERFIKEYPNTDLAYEAQEAIKRLKEEAWYKSLDAQAEKDAEQESKGDFQEENHSAMRAFLVKAANSNDLSIVDKALKDYSKHGFKTSFANQPDFSENQPDPHTLNSFPLKEYFDLLTKRNTLLLPLLDSVLYHIDDLSFIRAIGRTGSDTSDEDDTDGQDNIASEKNDTVAKDIKICNYIPKLEKLLDIDRIKIVADENPDNMNKRVLQFFDMQLGSPLQEKSYFNSLEFERRKAYFQSLRDYLLSSLFVIRCPKTKEDPMTDQYYIVKSEYPFGLKKYDLNRNQFPFVLSAHSSDEYNGEHNVFQNVYFPTINTKEVVHMYDCKDLFYFPVPSEDVAASVERSGECYFIFNINGVSVFFNKGLTKSILTAGKTRFVVMDTESGHIAYSHLFETIPVKKTAQPIGKPARHN